jgi:hypothetical protein
MSAQDHTEPARPWWASADPEVDRLDPDEDPLEAALSARNRTLEPDHGAGPAGTDGDAGPGPDRDAGPDPGPDRDAGPGTDRDAGRDDARAADATEICGVCPLCTGWRYLREQHPDVAAHLAAAGRHVSDAHHDVVDHLSAAGRHLAAAFRQILDDRGEKDGAGSTEPDGSPRGSADTRSPSPHRDRFERIDLDDEQGQV